MTYVIQRYDGVSSLYYSETIGIRCASPGGGWSEDLSEATTWNDREVAETFLEGPLHTMAPFCRVNFVEALS